MPSYRQSLMYGLLLSRNSVIIQLVFPYNCFVHSLLTLTINANKEATKLGIPSGHIYIETFSIQRTPTANPNNIPDFRNVILYELSFLLVGILDFRY